MESENPGSDAGPGKPEPDAPPSARQGPTPPPESAPAPAWTTPPPPATSPDAPTTAWTAPGPARPGPATPPATAWGEPAPPQPSPAAAPTGWGQPVPPQGSWGPPAAPQPPQPAPPPQWGPPVQAPEPGPWGPPGAPQPAWQGGPPPASGGGNGCLKACLIVGAILVVLAIIAVIGLAIAGASIVGGLGIDSHGNVKDCSIVSSAQVQTVLGPETHAGPLSGLANTIGGVALDKRVLPSAENCWIGSGSSPDSSQVNGEFGRVARHSGGDASSAFDQARSAAQTGGYFVMDVSGAGDQAFCTGWSEAYPGTGALVRKGNDLVYVSFLIGPNLDFTQASGENGVPYSPQACDDAVKIALLALH